MDRLVLAKGKPVLIGCGRDEQEYVISTVYERLKPRLNPTGRNRKDYVCHRLMPCWEKDDNDFPDLHQICDKLFKAAGFRDAFEGLLVVDTGAMVRKSECDSDRLSALAEALEIWCRRAFVVLLGPNSDESLCRAADALDLHGDMQVEKLNRAGQRGDVRSTMEKLGVAADDDVIEAVDSLLADCVERAGFDPEKAIRSILNGETHRITLPMVETERRSKFSYTSRFRMLRRSGPQNQRIGFDAQSAQAGKKERM